MPVHSIPCLFEEHEAAIVSALTADPERYWFVSVPECETSAEHFRVEDSGHILGYYFLRPNVDGVYLGGMANISEARGLGSHVLASLRHLHVYLDCYATPHLLNFYGSRGFEIVNTYEWNDDYAPEYWNPSFGKPAYVDMERWPSFALAV